MKYDCHCEDGRRPDEAIPLGRKTALFFLCGFIAVAACSSAPEKSGTAPRAAATVKTNQPRPDWTKRTPEPKGDEVFFVGIASAAETEEEGRKRARQDAYAQIAQYLGQSVSVDYRVERTVRQLGSSPAVSDLVVRDLERAVSTEIVRRARERDIFTETKASPESELHQIWILTSFNEKQSREVLAEAVRATEEGYRREHRDEARKILDEVKKQLEAE